MGRHSGRGRLLGGAAVALTAIAVAVLPQQAASAAGPVVAQGDFSTGGPLGGGSFTGTNPVEVPGPTGLWASGATSPTVPVALTTGPHAGEVVTVPVLRLRTTTGADLGGSGVPVLVTIGAQNDAAGPAPLPVPDSLRTDQPTGTPGSVAIQVWANQAYPGSLDSRATVPVTVTALDTDGSALSTHGTLRLAGGDATADALFSGDNGIATSSADSTGLPVGDGVITVTVLGPHSAAPVTATVPVTLVATAIQQVSTDVPYSTVYPVQDGYRDSVAISLNSTTSTGRPVAAQGFASIVRDGRTVASWKIRSSDQTLKWSGMTGRVLQPGSYVLHLSIKGLQGRIRTTTRTLTVSRKRLVTHVATGSFAITGAHGAVQQVTFRSPDGNAQCMFSRSALECTGNDRAGGVGSRIQLPSFEVPPEVLAAAKYGPIYTHFSGRVTTVTGHPEWLPSQDVSAPMMLGEMRSVWVKGGHSDRVSVQLKRSSHVVVEDAVLHFRYRTLQ